MVMFETLERRALLSAIGFATFVGPVRPLPATTAQGASGAQPVGSPSVNQPAPLPVQTELASQKIAILSWDQPRDASSFNGMVRVNEYQDPTTEANRAAPILMARQAGDRVVMVDFAMDMAYRPLDRNNPAAFVASGPAIGYDQNWFGTFFSRLKALGVPLDRVVVDSEQNLSTWYLLSGKPVGPDRVAEMQSIYSNAAAYAKFPAALRAYAPADFAEPLSPRGRAATIAWNAWANSVRQQAIKQAIVDPVRGAYGQSILVGNYGDMSPRMALRDRNNWPWADANATIPGNVSNPSTYLWNGQIYAKYQKDWRWNRLIDVLNVVRACQNVPNTTVTPWLSYPSFRGDGVPLAKSTWLWEQLVRHLAAGGIGSFYYWNPKEQTPQADDQMADALFKRLRVGTVTAATLQPIAFDADQIVTGSMTTTYAQFLQYVDAPTYPSSSLLDTQAPTLLMGSPTPVSAPSSVASSVLGTAASRWLLGDLFVGPRAPPAAASVLQSGK